MFYTYQKNYQTKHLAKNWQKMLQEREVIRNNYRITHNVKKAKKFVESFVRYSPHTHFVKHGEHVIFSRDMSIIPLQPAYVFAKNH